MLNRSWLVGLIQFCLIGLLVLAGWGLVHAYGGQGPLPRTGSLFRAGQSPWILGLYPTEWGQIFLTADMGEMWVPIRFNRLPGLKSTQAAGQVYYIDNSNGRDTNNGLSESTPWKTIAKVNATSFSPGDQILFKRGEHWHETLVPPSSGVAGSPIIFGSYSSGALPIIDEKTANDHNINVDSKSYLTFQNLQCQYGKYGMNFITVDHIIVQDCVVTNEIGWGILFDHAAYVLVENCTISGCCLAYNTSGGLCFNETPNSRIHNNVVYNNGGHGILLGSGSDGGGDYIEVDGNDVYSNIGAGLYMGDSSYCLIHDNHIHHNVQWEANPIKEPYGIGVSSSCSHNEFYDNELNDNDWMGLAFWVGGPLVSCDANKVYRNRIYNNLSHGICFESPAPNLPSWPGNANPIDNEIYYNLIYDNSLCGVRIIGGTGSGNKLYNNTIVGNPMYGGISLGGIPAIAWDVKNNICVNNLLQLLNDPGKTHAITHNHNLYYKTSGDLVGYNGVNYDATEIISGFEATALVSDPLFVDKTQHDYRLQSISPAINAGTNVGLTTDFDGNPIVNNPDMGAFEYQGMAPTPPPTNFTLAGRVTQADNSGLDGVTLNRSDGGSVTTANGGNYSVTVPSGWSGQITASYSSGSFEPAARSYSNFSANLSGQDFRWSPVVSPTILIISPNGGESWQTTSEQYITWTTSNLAGDVSLQLSRDGGVSWETLLANTANDGQEPWTVNGPGGNRNRIRIVSVNSPLTDDTSNSDFTILKAKQRLRLSLTQGWNLVTVPFQSTATASQVFASLPSGWTIYRWDSAYLRYTLAAEIHPEIGTGYWLKSPITTDLEIEGDAYDVPQFTKDLTIGWNLIGSPSTDSYRLANLRIMANETVYRYQEAIDRELIAANIFTFSNNQYEIANSTGILKPGFGYWIYTSTNCQIIF